MNPFADEDEQEEDLLDERPERPSNAPLGRKKAVAGFTFPLSWRWLISVVGAEYCHTYFWIAKDLMWMQGLRNGSIFFGMMALGWSMVILYHALRTVNWHEIWNFVALFLWIFANFIWMRGEAHDHEFPEDLPMANECSDMSALILSIALCWLLIYYCAFLPFNLIHSSKASLYEYDDGLLRPRCAVFRNFRQYENLHMLFWICKDLAWNRLNLPLWLVFLFPTMFISADLFVIAVTSNSNEYALDVTHFGVTLVWVTANSVWAFGDFFIEEYDEPLHIFDSSDEALMTARWYSAWILCFDVAVVACMYGLWITLTLLGRLAPAEGDLSQKHSMTGLNLTTGNGVLTYDSEGSGVSMGLVKQSRAGIVVQRNLSSSNGNGNGNGNGSSNSGAVPPSPPPIVAAGGFAMDVTKIDDPPR